MKVRTIRAALAACVAGALLAGAAPAAASDPLTVTAPAGAVEAILSEHDGALKRTGYTRDGDLVRRLYRLRASDAHLSELGDRLGAVPGVTGFRLDPRDD